MYIYIYIYIYICVVVVHGKIKASPAGSRDVSQVGAASKEDPSLAWRVLLADGAAITRLLQIAADRTDVKRPMSQMREDQHAGPAALRQRP